MSETEVDPTVRVPFDVRGYRVNEIFYSVQGEGARAGTAMVFVRFADCNLRCMASGFAGFDCDTEFSSGRWMTHDAILDEVRALGPDAPWVLLTGGEPLLQVDEPLVEMLHGGEYHIALETNGTIEAPGAWFDHATVSPKSADHTIRFHDPQEIRYVRREGQAIPVPPPTIRRARDRFISPAFQPDGTLRRGDVEWCVQLVKENPTWRLSLQLHKMIGVR